MNKLHELRARMAEIKAELEELSARDELTTEDEERTAALITEFETAEAEAAPLEERAAKLAHIRDTTVTTENGDAAENRGADGLNRDFQRGTSTPSGDEVFVLDRSVFAGRSTHDVDTELRGRALKAVEAVRGLSDEARQAVTERIERDADPTPDEDTGFRGYSEHVLRTGSPTYRSAFRKFLKDQRGLSMTEEERAALSLTGANGGYLLPFVLDPTIILTNSGATNPFRQISRVIQVSQNTWHGVSTAGVTAEWLPEATEAADASPTFVQPTISANKAAAWIQASYEFTEDSSFENELGMLLADAKDRLEATAFATGSGSNQPKGIVTALQAVTASRVSATTNATFGPADIFALDNSLGARWRSNASFVGNKAVWNLARQFGTANNYFAFWTDFGGGNPPGLIGYPVYESSAMTSSLSSATASNDDVVVLGDFRQYVIVDRIGMSLAYEPLVKGSNRRPTGEVGWFAHWRVGADTTNADAFRLLRV